MTVDPHALMLSLSKHEGPALQPQPAPNPSTEPVDTLKLAMLSILIWGTQPIYMARQAELLRQYEQEGLVEIADIVPHPPRSGRRPRFYARLTRTGQALLSWPMGEA